MPFCNISAAFSTALCAGRYCQDSPTQQDHRNLNSIQFDRDPLLFLEPPPLHNERQGFDKNPDYRIFSNLLADKKPVPSEAAIIRRSEEKRMNSVTNAHPVCSFLL